MGSASIFAGGLGRLRASGWWILTSHLSLTTGPNNPFPLRTGSASSTAPSTETVGDPGAGATAATGSAEPGAGANAWPGAGESSTEVDIAPTAPQKNNKVRIVARPQIIDCIPFTTAPKYVQHDENDQHFQFIISQVRPESIPHDLLDRLRCRFTSGTVDSHFFFREHFLSSPEPANPFSYSTSSILLS
ncbi:hypothetical protein PAPYR_12307 [Paratrimastix pyriformis]|uniref:Uncharacterized protein n=1 Tax=Paratrimastix pyriformis TaxID=342808 RepID=A0ABQ8U237_9EUKA|nr:hypothetical protein PAPYR_12307 [Paratrimastix pyriformis]